LRQQIARAEHLVGDIVAEQDVVLPARLFMQECIELDDTANLGSGYIQCPGELVDGRSGNAVELMLNLAQVLQKVRALCLVSCADRRNDRSDYFIW
jgi:hypothetical protein